MKGFNYDQIKKLLPLYVLISVILLVVAAFSVIISINRLRKISFKLVERDGVAIVDMAVQAGRNGLEASYVVDNLVAERLISIADLIGRLPKLNERILRDIVAINDLYAIDILSSDGKVIVTSRMSRTLPFPADSITSRGNGSVSVFQLNLKGKDIYVLVVPNDPHGFIAVYFDVGYLNRLKYHISIGRIIQRLGRNPAVVYIAFQDTAGIIAATENIQSLASINSDTFLRRAMLDTNSVLRRVTDFRGEKVFEFVKPIYINGQFEGLFRLGLSLSGYRSIVAAGQRQIVILVVFVAVVLMLMLAFFLFSRGYGLLQVAYEELELSFDEMLEQLPLGAVLLTPDMKIRSCNQLFCSYFPQKLVRGSDYLEIFSDDPLGILMAKSKGEPVTIEDVILRDASGKRRTYTIRTAPIIARDGIAGYISIVEDITDKLEAERVRQRLRELDLIAELAAALAHDIRNPLNSINLMAQRLMRHADEKIRETGTRIKESVGRVEMQMREFLQLAAPLRVNRVETDIADFVGEIIRDWDDRFKAFRITVEPELKSVRCRIDRVRMRRALENLIDNAIQAMPDGGKLTVKTYSDGNDCVIEVSDTGVGIPDDVIDQIFRPYFTTKPNGTGLGLSQVERTVRAHGGHIDVESQPDKGTTFRIYLPIRD